MSDNLTLNAGSGGSTLKTDELADLSHVQYVKLMDGTANGTGAIPGDATNGLTVNLGTNNDVTVTGTVTVNGSGVTQPVSAASLPLPSGAATSANQTTVIGHLDGVEGLLTTIDADTGIVAALSKAADAVAGGTDTGIPILAIRDDALTTLTPVDGDYAPLRVSSTGALHVTGGGGGTEYAVDTALGATPTGTVPLAIRDDALSALTPVEGDAIALRVGATGALWTAVSGTVTVDGSGVTQPVSGTVTANLSATDNAVLDQIEVNTSYGDVVGGGVEATALRVTIASDSTGVVSIDDNGGAITVDGTVAVTNAGITTIAGAVSGTEMQCDVLTLPNVTLAAGTNTNEVVGDVAHDAAAAGNPVGISGVAQTMDDTAPPNRVSAEGDATRLATSLDGSIFAHPHGPQVWSYHVNGSSALTDATVHAAPGAGLSLYVTDIVISSGAATAMNAFFEEGASTVLGPYYLEAVAGRGCAIHFGTPKKITANTALTVTSSAAIAHSIDVCGYIAPA